MKQTGRKVLHVFLGGTLIMIGVLGLVLPIINGTVLLIVGFIILSFESPVLEKYLFHLTQKNATIHLWHLRLEKVVRKFFNK